MGKQKTKGGVAGETPTREVDVEKLRRTTEEVYTPQELRAKLGLLRPLRVKYGVDVTAPFLHIGHAVNLWMMRHLQDCSHKVIFLIGDFTTQIGDPTGKTEARRVIPKKEIEKNAKDFITQVSRILLTDPKVFEVRRNSEWYRKMKVGDFISLISLVTHAKLIQRDMFQKRIAQGQDIHAHEMIYPILQGYDSVMLKSDLTIVGSDQLFNELMGRFLQEKFKQDPQVVVTTKITPGLDGKEKQSKSLGNYIALSDTPKDKFGKVMSLPDALIIPYMEVYTDMPPDTIGELAKDVAGGVVHPMEAKKRLGRALVERYHGAEKAGKAEEEFARVFQKKEAPQHIQDLAFKGSTERNPAMIELLIQTGSISSKAEAKRLIAQGGVAYDGKPYTDSRGRVEPRDGAILRVGKRRFFRIKKPE